MSSPQDELPGAKPDRPDREGDRWDRRERLNKTEAERLLDWLEANGYSQRDASLAEDGSFTVRWRR